MKRSPKVFASEEKATTSTSELKFVFVRVNPDIDLTKKNVALSSVLLPLGSTTTAQTEPCLVRLKSEGRGN